MGETDCENIHTPSRHIQTKLGTCELKELRRKVFLDIRRRTGRKMMKLSRL